VLVLHATTLQVSLLTALSGVAAAVIALPFGTGIEFRRKRPVMVIADLARFAALASVPVAAAAGLLTFTQLCLVAVVQTLGTIAFGAASGAHLKALAGPDHLMAASSRFETTNWLSQAAGPPAGGLLISATGATATVIIDGLSFLLSALGVGRIRAPEPPPPARPAGHRIRHDLVSGWRYIFAHRPLKLLFWNSMVFGGPVVLTSSLLAVLMLRDLRLAPWEYGLALGVPCLGGTAGSRLAPALTRRFGLRRVLLGSGACRVVWLLPIALARPGPAGLAIIMVAETGLLVSAGVFNPSFATTRLLGTDDAHLARVLTSWTISSRTVQPAFVLAGGLLAAAASIQLAIGLGGLVCASSAILLPWRPDPKPSSPSPLSPETAPGLASGASAGATRP
jgi:hypothetical protein